MAHINDEHLKDLKGNELKLLITLRMKAQGADHIQISLDDIHGFMKPICLRTCIRIIKALTTKGYLRSEWSGGPTPAIYYFLK